MNKTGRIGLLLAFAVPLIAYFVITYLSKDAVHIPQRYFYDSVGVTTVRGKSMPDTIWHQVNNISLTNQLGKKVNLHDIRGKAIVMNFIFSRCPSICPNMTKNMKRLQDSYVKNPDLVQFLSFSVDPTYDSVDKLRAFADKYHVNHDNWWFLTGNKDSIYNFALHEIKSNIADPNIDSVFIHTEKFFLLDSNFVVRGFYDGLDTVALANMARDISILSLEKGKESPSIFRSFIPILPIIFLGIAGVMFVMYRMNKNRKKY